MDREQLMKAAEANALEIDKEFDAAWYRAEIAERAWVYNTNSKFEAERKLRMQKAKADMDKVAFRLRQAWDAYAKIARRPIEVLIPETIQEFEYAF